MLQTMGWKTCIAIGTRESTILPNILKQVANIKRYPLDYPGIGDITKNTVNLDFEAKYPSVIGFLDINTNMINNLFTFINR